MNAPGPQRRFQFGLGTMLLLVTFLAPWFFLYTYVRERKPELAPVFLGVLGFALFMVVIVVIANLTAHRIKPSRGLNYEIKPNRASQWAYAWGICAVGMLVNPQWWLWALTGIVAALAVFFGAKALLELRNDEKTPGRFHAWFGFVAGCVGIVVVAVRWLGYYMIWPFYLI